VVDPLVTAPSRIARSAISGKYDRCEPPTHARTLVAAVVATGIAGALALVVCAGPSTTWLLQGHSGSLLH
jgi:hypothetical protein